MFCDATAGNSLPARWRSSPPKNWHRMLRFTLFNGFPCPADARHATRKTLRTEAIPGALPMVPIVVRFAMRTRKRQACKAPAFFAAAAATSSSAVRADRIHGRPRPPDPGSPVPHLARDHNTLNCHKETGGVSHPGKASRASFRIWATRGATAASFPASAGERKTRADTIPRRKTIRCRGRTGTRPYRFLVASGLSPQTQGSRPSVSA